MDKRLQRKAWDLQKAAYYAVGWLYRYSRRPRFSEGFLLETHRILLAHNPKEAGIFRDVRHKLKIKGGTFVPVDAHLIRFGLDELLFLINNRRRWWGIFRKHIYDKLDPKIKANKEAVDFLYAIFMTFYFHHRLVVIHPFCDGNGRMARLVMCILLRELGISQSSYPPLINKIIRKSRSRYLDALNAADDGKFFPGVNYMLGVIKGAYQEAEKEAKQVNEHL